MWQFDIYTKITKITKKPKWSYDVEVNGMDSKERACYQRNDSELDKGGIL